MSERCAAISILISFIGTCINNSVRATLLYQGTLGITEKEKAKWQVWQKLELSYKKWNPAVQVTAAADAITQYIRIGTSQKIQQHEFASSRMAMIRTCFSG
jgi:hypothetical protein